MNLNIRKIKQKYDKSIREIEEKIKSEFTSHFKEFYKNNQVPKITNSKKSISCFYEVRDYKTTQDMFSGNGLYVIFSDYGIQDNPCILNFEKKYKAIYRGQCSTIRRRIESHLFNSEYNKNYYTREKQALDCNKNFGEVRYNTCMKLEGKNGINITDSIFKKFGWFVVIHKMIGSNRLIREQAEKAFDELFNRPLASQEIKK